MEFSAENVCRAVEQFYSGCHSGPNEQAAAHAWLTEAQSSQQAWSFVWDLLRPEKSAQVQFFAASTLHRKVARGFAELPAAQIEPLETRLLETVAEHWRGPRAVLARLCAALGALVAQTLCPGRVAALASRLSPGSAPGAPPARLAWTLMLVLTALPDEIAGRANRKPAFGDTAQQVLALVEEALSTDSGGVDGAAEMRHQAVLCAAAWLAPGAPLPDCERLAHLLAEAACSAPADQPDMTCAALDALGQLATQPDAHKYPAAVLRLIARLLPLSGLLQQRQDDKVVESAVYSLLVSVAESHSRLLLDTLAAPSEHSADAGRLLQLVLACSCSPGIYPLDETSSQLALGFWYILQDDLLAAEPAQRRAALPTLRAVYRQLAEAMLRKSRLPELRDPAWSAEDRESLRCYRQDVADTLMYCYSVLREDLLALLLSRLSEGLTAGSWTDSEAALHGFLAVAECVEITETRHLPQLFELLAQLPMEQMDTRVASTALDAIGAYAEWMHRHPEALARALPLLLAGLANTETAPPATMALKEVSRDCQRHMPPFAPQLLTACQESLCGGRLRLGESVRLMYTVGRVLATLNDTDRAAWLDLLLLPRVHELHQLAAQEISASVQAAISLRLKMISTLCATLDTKSAQERDDQGDATNTGSQDCTQSGTQPVFLVLQHMLPVLRVLTVRWSTDEHVTQDICATLKHGLSTLLDAARPLLTEMLDMTLMSFRLSPSPSALDLARQFVLLFGRDEPAMMGSFLAELCGTTLSTPAQNGASDQAEVLEALFALLAQVLKKNAALFADTPGINIEAIFQAAVLTLALPESGPSKAAASFLAQLVTHSRDRPALGSVVQAQGGALVTQLLACIGGSVPRAAVEPLSELLAALVKKHSDSTGRWLSLALAQEGFPSARATKQQGADFAKAIMRDRANKRKLQEAVREFSLVCRGLTGADIGAQPASW